MVFSSVIQLKLARISQARERASMLMHLVTLIIDFGPNVSKSHIENRNSSRFARSFVGQSACLTGSGGDEPIPGIVLFIA